MEKDLISHPPPADIPGVIAPPPFIYLGGLVAGFALEGAWPIPVPHNTVAGVVIAALGVALMGWGIATFRRARTDYVPYRPATRLIVTGPFRFTRNPLYLSLTVIYLGIAVASGNLWLYLCLILVLFLMRFGVIGREEAYLERRFGPAYGAYKARIPRWIGWPR